MRHLIAACLLVCLGAAPASAHDFFISPSAHRVAAAEPVTIVMHVGSELEMDELPRSNRRIVRFEGHLGTAALPVAGKHGESPAGKIGFAGKGVATIVYQSSHTDIELPGSKFEHYLVEEGLEDISAERAKLGVTQSPGRESYARYAKTLVTVGGGDDGWNRKVGLPAELVALTDPRAGGTAQFQLFYEDKPRANARVDVLRIEKTKLTSVAHARTDAEGKVALAIPGDGVWLVATTLMRAAPPALGLEGDWESFWVSIEFEAAKVAPRSAGGCATSDPGALGFTLLVLSVLESARRKRKKRTTMKTQLALALTLAASTFAFADSHSEKKDAMKKDAKPVAGAPAMAAPTPPAELAAMAKTIGGNWKCKGKGAMDPANPTAMTEFAGTYKAAAELDKFWIKGEWSVSVGKMKMRGFVFTTFDATTKKWHRVMLDNGGGSGWESSGGLPAGATEGKLVWEGEARMGGQAIKNRSTEEVSAKTFKLTGEMSPDGKKWMTGMEMTCTK
jgi:uncharacterized GH25 family protein